VVREKDLTSQKEGKSFHNLNWGLGGEVGGGGRKGAPKGERRGPEKSSFNLIKESSSVIW